ncbi:MAG: hypothetical protein D8M59_10535 [Planctomycetes bacterium]|nr:hypothetical protein [Planctomycetota bacterium]NOG55280.1 hypothetical protein [Planctomycetota bacterium]
MHLNEKTSQNDIGRSRCLSAWGCWSVPPVSLLARACALFTLCLTCCARADEYAIIQLETTEKWSFGESINSLGLVCGAASGDPLAAPIVWERDNYLKLGNLGGNDSTAQAISDSGVVVGYSGYPDFREIPFVWIQGRGDWMALPMPDGYDVGRANGVNEHNQAVGFCRHFELGDSTAVTWTSGQVNELPGLGGWGSAAADISDSGWIVGWAVDDQLTRQAVLWTSQSTIVVLGTLGGWWSVGTAYGVNDFGQITGFSEASVDEHAFLWQDGEMFDIHDHPWDTSIAFGIANTGEVVGTLIKSSYGEWTAFLWRDGSGMLELRNMLPPNSNWTNLEQALDINEFGQIVGYGFRSDRNSYNHGFLMTPIYPTFTLDQPSPGVAGEVNTITARNLTPGAKVYLIYGMVGGGSIIPRCEIVEAALQIDDPVIAGTAIANANGIATLVGKVPSKWAGQEVLIQGLVSSECDISNLIVVKFE